MDISSNVVASQKRRCLLFDVRYVYGENPKNNEMISFLMYQIFVQTIFELQIAFNGIKFHIFAKDTKEMNVYPSMRLKG